MYSCDPEYRALLHHAYNTKYIQVANIYFRRTGCSARGAEGGGVEGEEEHPGTAVYCCCDIALLPSAYARQA
jgi:hypothetical protein